jgi:AsmA protein
MSPVSEGFREIKGGSPMKRPRLRVRWLVLLGLLAVPPLLWALLLLIIPTDWARGRIVTRLSQASGRAVRLESLRVGALGGIRLTNLAIGAPRSGDDPWLTVADAQVNVNLLQLLTGHVDPTEIRVDGISLRVRRRTDGTLELSDLLQAPAAGSAEADAETRPDCPGPTGLQVWVSGARVEVIDEPTATKLLFDRVEGRATCSGRRATIHELKGTLNGGPFELVAHLDRSSPSTSFEGQIRARDVVIGDGMNLLSYAIGPVLSGSRGYAEGRLDLNVYARGTGTSRNAIQGSLVGHGELVLDPVRLDDSKLMAQLAPLVELPAQGRVGSVRTKFTIRDRRVATDDLTISLGKLPVVLAGWTDFDGRLNYRLRTEGLTERLPNQARDFLSELSIDLKELNALKVQGTVDALAVTLDGAPLHDRDDRARFREAGRRLLDRIRR